MIFAWVLAMVLGAVGQVAAVQQPSSEAVQAAPRHTLVPGRKISGSNPVYPAKARSEKLEGTVVLKATVTTTGELTNIVVVTSPGDLLSKAAIKAVRSWRYSPYMRDGEPIEIETRIPVNFRLN